MYQEIKSKTLYWGFPICLISSLNKNNKTDITPISSIYNVNEALMIGINITSQAYANIKQNKKIIVNVIPDTMWSNIEKIANFTANPNNKSKNNFTTDKTKIGDFNLINSTSSIQIIDNTLLYLEADYNAEIIINGVAHINFNVSKIFVKPDLIDKDGFLIDDKFNILLYQFRKYKSIDQKVLGTSFRYEKQK